MYKLKYKKTINGGHGSIAPLSTLLKTDLYQHPFLTLTTFKWFVLLL